ncbi:MAG: DUF3787 domain-containing protein [Oscillospiraceae bacterium]|nr:DUF3787 domain-containing protein [Oscillospiraceae bacterium]
MPKNKNSKKSDKTDKTNINRVPANLTFALATNTKTEPSAKITIPTDSDVEDARDFIGENKL